MGEGVASPEYLGLLNDALARELQVSVQYMLQHAVQAGLARAGSGRSSTDRQATFIGSHTPYFVPGSRLKKIAITEMRHAEAIAERIVLLGGEPISRPHPLAMGATSLEMLHNDRAAELEAIDLYTRIIAVAEEENDTETARLFRRVLSDERRHLQAFSGLLA